MTMFLYCRTTTDDSTRQSDKCSAIIPIISEAIEN